LDDEYDNFSGNIKPVPLEPIIGRLFQKIIPRRSGRSSFIDPFSFAKKCCNASQGFGAFFFQSCDGLFFFFFFLVFFSFFLIFLVTGDCVLNQLHICIAYNFKFQQKRNELRHPAKKILHQ